MELPVINFITTILDEADSTLETRPGSAYYDLFINPQQLMLQPLINTTDQIMVSQSIRQIMLQPDPDAYPQADVDDLLANLYVFRYQGTFSTTTVRVFYTSPIDADYPASTAQFTAGSLSFFNTNDISVTSQQMALQTNGTLYYMDVPVTSQFVGSSYNVAIGAIVGFVNDATAVLVSNLTAATGGTSAETNTQVLTRAANSIGVRDLETIKGINAILTGKFSFIKTLQPIGFGDPEMQRDILYNVHVGGKTDVYINTGSLTPTFQTFSNIPIDTTRKISQNLHIDMATSATDPNVSASVGTPNIVVGSVEVQDDVIETAASILSNTIPTVSGIDLTGHEFLRLEIDTFPSTLIKVSGAIVAHTQIYEIINAINTAIGYTVAFKATGNKVMIDSTITGLGSQIIFQDPTPTTSAANILFGINSFPSTITGVVADRYIETIDYSVDYINGLVYQTPFPGARTWPTILSGQTFLSDETDGQITEVSGEFFLNASTPNRFINTSALVKTMVGDFVIISEINGHTTGTVLGTLPQTFIVNAVNTTSNLSLENFNPTGTTGVNQVTYSVVSNQTVVVNYQYNPLSLDIGNAVLLPDGVNRGVRVGRGAYTLDQMPFINIIAIQQIDPVSGQLIDSPLIPPSGYGGGGYGQGGYGVGLGGDYQVMIIDPPDRFSMFDDGVIILNPNLLGTSLRVDYNTIPELEQVHNLCRNDGERVTGADVLPKNAVPVAVSMTVPITRDPTNSATPSDAALGVLVDNYISGVLGTGGVKASDIVRILLAQGVETVHEPFTMTATVYNTDGTTSILSSQDILILPTPTLLSQDNNYGTPRISAFYSLGTVITEV